MKFFSVLISLQTYFKNQFRFYEISNWNDGNLQSRLKLSEGLLDLEILF